MGTVHSTMKTCDEGMIASTPLYESVAEVVNQLSSGLLSSHQLSCTSIQYARQKN